MNFQNLLKIEKYDFYLDVAFRRAKEQLSELRSTGHRTENKRGKSKFLEIERIDVVKKSLCGALGGILTSFPSIDSMDIFYLELVKCTTDYPMLKKSLGAVNWAKTMIEGFHKKEFINIKSSRTFDDINMHRRAFYGRACSIMKQIKSELAFLEEARKILRNFPTIKTSLPTVCICGFPNVGKSTLLSKLTTAKPEIKEYAFTTKSLNIGYMEYNRKKIQLIDTPGSLNRINKMNNIEKQAYLALKHCADLIIYVFDVTEPFPLKEQKELHEIIKKFNKKIIVYLSKTDILDENIVKRFKKEYHSISDLELLKKEIFNLLPDDNPASAG